MLSAGVTGGQGFIGRHLVDALRRRGVNATTVGRSRSVDPEHIVMEEASWDSPALEPLCQLAINSDARGFVNVCSGEALLLRELVEMLVDRCGRKIEIEIDWSRGCGSEPRVVIGSADLPAGVGCPSLPTDFQAVIGRVCRSMEESQAEAS